MKDIKQFIKSLIRESLNENKYSDPTYRSLMKIYDIPVDFMWKYREFDRCGDDNLYGKDYIERLTKDIEENGIKNPITLQIDNGKGLIVEGNHRLCIAIKLGLKTIPVKVDLGTPFGSINKNKAKPINYNSDLWKMGMWDNSLTNTQLKGIAKSFIRKFELPYYEYKNKLNFEEFDNWLTNNEQIIDFLIGDSPMNNVEPFDNNQKLTNEILNLLKSKFDKEIK